MNGRARLILIIVILLLAFAWSSQAKAQGAPDPAGGGGGGGGFTDDLLAGLGGFGDGIAKLANDVLGTLGGDPGKPAASSTPGKPAASAAPSSAVPALAPIGAPAPPKSGETLLDIVFNDIAKVESGQIVFAPIPPSGPVGVGSGLNRPPKYQE